MMPESTFSNRSVALVTGANRGIGKAIALKLARRGYNLALVGRNEEQLKDIKAECFNASKNLLPASEIWPQPTFTSTEHQYFLCDLSQPLGIESLLQTITEYFGKLDVLINNAGVSIEEDATTANLINWDIALDINLKACIHLVHHAIPLLMKSGLGIIINIGSTAGIKTYRKGAIYCATKHGLRGFSLALFEDLRNLGIKTCLIEPGYVNTDMHDPDKEGLAPWKMLHPDDVAEAVEYIIGSNPRACPTEIVLIPTMDPRMKEKT